MSVLAFVINATDENRGKFSIPVATESFFKKCWKKAIYELNLELLSQIEYGLEFGIDELPKVMEELNMVLAWSSHNLDCSDLKLISERISLLIKKLPEAFVNKENIVYIG